MLADPLPELRGQLADRLVTLASQTNFFIAADVLQIDYARMSDLRRGRIERFSIQWLIRKLAIIDHRVDLTIVNSGWPNVRWMKILFDRHAEQRRRKG